MRAKVLFASGLVTVTDQSCDAPRSGRGAERCGRLSSVTVVRRGVHAHHVRGGTWLAEPGRALLYRGGDSYRFSHPFHRDVSDRATCIEFGDALLDEVFGPARRAPTAFLAPPTLLGVHRLTARLGATPYDSLAAEEATVAVLQSVATELGAARDDPPRSATSRRRVGRAQAFIAARPEQSCGLDSIAAAAGCSPFHLARLFRRETGMTIRGYRLRLRVSTALQEIAEGESDLTSVALRTGFFDHAHMTASVRRLLGAPPSALRSALAGAQALTSDGRRTGPSSVRTV